MNSRILGTVTFVFDNVVINGIDLENVIDYYIKPIIMHLKECAHAEGESPPTYSLIVYRNMPTEVPSSRIGKSLGPFEAPAEILKLLRRLALNGDNSHVFGNLTLVLCWMLNTYEEMASEEENGGQHIILIGGGGLREDPTGTRQEFAQELGRNGLHFSVITLKPNPDVYGLFLDAAGDGPVTVDNAAKHPTHMALLKAMNVPQIMAYTEKDFNGAFD